MTATWEARLDALAQLGNSARWALAAFAYESKAEGVPGWADKIAAHPLIRRKPYTIMHYARAHEIGERYPAIRDRLPFSAWATLARWENGTNADDLREAVDELLTNPMATVEDLEARLRELFGDKTDDSRGLYPVGQSDSPTVRARLANGQAVPVVILEGWSDIEQVRVTASRAKGNGR